VETKNAYPDRNTRPGQPWLVGPGACVKRQHRMDSLRTAGKKCNGIGSTSGLPPAHCCTGEGGPKNWGIGGELSGRSFRCRKQALEPLGLSSPISPCVCFHEHAAGLSRCFDERPRLTPPREPGRGETRESAVVLIVEVPPPGGGSFGRNLIGACAVARRQQGSIQQGKKSQRNCPCGARFAYHVLRRPTANKVHWLFR